MVVVMVMLGGVELTVCCHRASICLINMFRTASRPGSRDSQTPGWVFFSRPHRGYSLKSRLVTQSPTEPRFAAAAFLWCVNIVGIGETKTAERGVVGVSLTALVPTVSSKGYTGDLCL